MNWRRVQELQPLASVLFISRFEVGIAAGSHVLQKAFSGQEIVLKVREVVDISRQSDSEVDCVTAVAFRFLLMAECGANPTGSPAVSRLLLCATLLGIAAAAHAAPDCSRPLSQHQIQIWQHEDGLPLDTVYALAQTPDGFLWVGTESGIARFDGLRFQSFDLINELGTQRHASNYVESLAVSGDGTLYIGTSSSPIIVFRNGEFSIPEDQTGPQHPLHTLLVHDGMVYAGSRGGGFKVVGEDGVTVHHHDESHNIFTISDLAVRSAGGIWLATVEDGVLWFDGQAFHALEGYPELAGLRVEAIHEDRAGRLWVGSRQGLYRLEAGALRPYAEALDALNYIKDLTEDQQGNIWIGTGGAGVARVCGEKLEFLGEAEGLPIGQIEQVFADASGDIWLATGGGGLVRISKGAALPLTPRQGFPPSPILPILQGSDGAVWIGTFGGGLVRFIDGEVRVFGKDQGLASDKVLSLAQASDGGIWAGTRQGLYHVTDAGVQLLATAEDLPDQTIVSLLQEGKTLWVGTVSGLASIRDGAIRTYSPEHGNFGGHVIALMSDTDGVLWIGTDGGGIFRLRDGLVQRYQPLAGFPTSIVVSLYQSADGTIWIGTSSGVVRIREGSAALIGQQNGLPDPQVFSFLEDARGGMWMSGNRGVFRVPIHEMHAVAEGRIERLSVRLFDANDGMPRSETNGGFQPAAWRTRDGRHWYPTTDGVAVFDPENVALDPTAPPPVITAARVEDASVARSGNFIVAPDPLWVRFDYTAPEFSDPASLEFKYQLQGFDEGWYWAGSERQALYRRLPAGEYVFEVRSRFPGGGWSPPSRSTFVVEQHLFRNPWFLASCTIVLLAISGALLWRQYRIRAAQKERRRQAQKLESLGLLASGVAHDFNNVLTAILGYSQLASCDLDPGHPVQDSIDEIDKAAQRGAALSRQLLAFGRQQEGEPQPLELAPAVQNVHGFLRRLIPESISMQVNLDPAAGYCRIDAVQFEQIVLNLVVNARDAMPSGGTLSLELATLPRGREPEGIEVPETAHCACFTVRDNGAGIEPAVQARLFEPFFTTKPRGEGTGLGLSVIYGIVRQSGGIVEVESQPGLGTAFHVYLPAYCKLEDSAFRAEPGESP